MLDKMLGAFKAKIKPAQEEQKPVVVLPPEAVKPAVKPAVDPAKVAEWEAKVVAYVYDAELALEIAPVFAAMEGQEGFDKLIELLDSKEKQIEAISKGSSEGKTSPETKGKDAKSVDNQEPEQKASATDILKERFAKK